MGSHLLAQTSWIVFENEIFSCRGLMDFGLLPKKGGAESKNNFFLTPDNSQLGVRTEKKI